jgi:hypothetical protein
MTHKTLLYPLFTKRFCNLIQECLGIQHPLYLDTYDNPKQFYQHLVSLYQTVAVVTAREVLGDTQQDTAK